MNRIEYKYLYIELNKINKNIFLSKKYYYLKNIKD